LKNHTFLYKTGKNTGELLNTPYLAISEKEKPKTFFGQLMEVNFIFSAVPGWLPNIYRC
jgi:hypothetical protein